jgi:hypothetical protein
MRNLFQEIFLFFSGYRQNVQSMVLSNQKLWVFADYNGGKR